MTDFDLQPDATCDGGDLDCGSGLLLIIRSAMAPLPPSGVLLVKSREVSVKEDLPAWCRMVGHSLLSQVTAEGGYTHYFLRKKDDDQQLAKDLERARAHVWQVRVRWNEGMAGKVTVRNHGFQVGQPASFDTEDAAPSALEFLLAAIAGAITVAFQWRLSRQGATVFALEVVAKAKSQNILYFLGVEDEGSPALDSVEVSVYVDADADADLLQRSLDETLQRCPVTRTLLQNCAVQTRLSIIGS